MQNTDSASQNEFKENAFWHFIERIVKPYEKQIAWLLVLIIIVFVPIKITSTGWRPSDDALRHCAHAVSGKSWSDVVIMRPEFATDHNPGWHAILKFLHRNYGLDQHALLVFSILSLYILFNLTGAILCGNPIAWLTASALVFISHPGLTFRQLLGRPYIFTYSAYLTLLYLWGIKPERFSLTLKLLFSTILLSITVWIHGSWYLFLLIPLGLFLAGRTRCVIHITACIIFASIFGALLTQEPIKFLIFHAITPLSIFTEKLADHQLVKEFQSLLPQMGTIFAIFLVAIIAYIKGSLKPHQLAKNPLFIIILLCWAGGIMTLRIWHDWGVPALIIWLAINIRSLINSMSILRSPRIKYSLAIFFCITFYLVATVDYNSRYSRRELERAIIFEDEKLKMFEPENDSIIYADSMGAFYMHYFLYPQKNWKYILGFESAMMPEIDLKIWRKILFDPGNIDYIDEWIKKLRPQDRFISTKSYPSNAFSKPMKWIRGSRSFYIGMPVEAKEKKHITTEPD